MLDGHYTILNNVDAALAIIDKEGVILFVNDYDDFYRNLIKDKPIEINTSLIEAIPVEYRNMAKNTLERAFSSKTPIAFEASCNDEFGVKLYFQISCKVVDQNNMLIEVREITKQKIFENKMQSVSQEMSNLVEHANAVIMGMDSRGYVTEWNKMSSELIGYSKNETLTKQLQDIIIEQQFRVEFQLAMKKVYDGSLLSNYELPVRIKGGSHLTLLINATPKLNSAGQVIGVLIVGQDVTELIEYRKSLEIQVRQRTEKLLNSYQEIKQQKALIEKEQVKSDKLLLNVLPKAIADELKEKGSVAPRHYPFATILFADLVGFTKLGSTMTPGDLLYELDHLFTGFDHILDRNNMQRIKTIGDGYMAVGGVPIENDSNPTDAVNTGLEIANFVKMSSLENQKFGRPAWEIRIGIHTGNLVAGVIGKTKFTYDIWGGAVNIASRMESGGAAGEVNISQATWHLIKDKFECESRGVIEVKNMGSMNMYYVRKPRTVNNADSIARNI